MAIANRVNAFSMVTAKASLASPSSSVNLRISAVNADTAFVTSPFCSTMSLLPHVRQQPHVPGPLDGERDGVLAGRAAAGLAAADDLAVAVDQFFEQLHVLVVHEHRPRADAVDPDRILLLDLDPRLGLPLGAGVFLIERLEHRVETG